MTEILLSLRVNALQIPPDQRRNLVEQLVKIDIFNITETKSQEFVLSMLAMKNHGLKHALLALISVIVSTSQGVQYLTHTDAGTMNLSILEKIISTLKEQEDGSVTQRFNIAILQKMSAQNSAQLADTVTESIIDVMVKKNLIPWCLTLLHKARKPEGIHTFCLDFASALLANILHASGTLEMLETNQRTTSETMDSLLNLINQQDIPEEQMPTSVLIHCLICLSYLSKERFSQTIDQCNFVDRISQFVETFSMKQIGESDQESSDKKTILDLCAHMFHPKDTTNANDVSATMEYNELKQEEKVREF